MWYVCDFYWIIYVYSWASLHITHSKMEALIKLPISYPLRIYHSLSNSLDRTFIDLPILFNTTKFIGFQFVRILTIFNVVISLFLSTFNKLQKPKLICKKKNNAKRVLIDFETKLLSFDLKYVFCLQTSIFSAFIFVICLRFMVWFFFCSANLKNGHVYSFSIQSLLSSTEKYS